LASSHPASPIPPTPARLLSTPISVRPPTPCLVLLCLRPMTVHLPFWAVWRSPTMMANGGKGVFGGDLYEHQAGRQAAYPSFAQPATVGRSVSRSIAGACLRRSHHTTTTTHYYYCSGRDSARDVCSLSSGRMSGTRMLFCIVYLH
jgi:hypothetical protein